MTRRRKGRKKKKRHNSGRVKRERQRKDIHEKEL